MLIFYFLLYFSYFTYKIYRSCQSCHTMAVVNLRTYIKFRNNILKNWRYFNYHNFWIQQFWIHFLLCSKWESNVFLENAINSNVSPNIEKLLSRLSPRWIWRSKLSFYSNPPNLLCNFSSPRLLNFEYTRKRRKLDEVLEFPSIFRRLILLLKVR